MRTHTGHHDGPSGEGTLASRAARRRAVMAIYLGYPALLLCLALARGLPDPRPWWFPILLLPLGIAVLVGLAALLSSWVWQAANQEDSALDERQRRVRDRAYLHAYQGLGALVILTAVYAMFARNLGWWLPTTGLQMQALFWGVFLLCLTLPTAIVAWTEPDLPTIE